MKRGFFQRHQHARMLLSIFAGTLILFAGTCIFWNLSFLKSAHSQTGSLEEASEPVDIEDISGTLSETDEEILEEDIDQLQVVDDETKTENATITEETSTALDTGQNFLPLPLKALGTPVQYSGEGIRIGFVTDPHTASGRVGGGYRLKDVFVQKITHIVEQMNNVFGPDFILINGDIIEGTKVPTWQGMGELRQTKALFDQTVIPKYWVLGNHDVRSVKKDEWEEALGIEYTRKAFRVKGYKIIILDSNFNQQDGDVSPGPGHSYTRGRVSESELKWLKKELSTPEKKIIFLHHVPLRKIGIKPDLSLLKNADDVQSLITEGNVVAVFSGHIEDLYFTRVNGVQYFVFPGMTKSPDYPGNFLVLDIVGDTVTAQMSYRQPSGKYTTVDIKPQE